VREEGKNTRAKSYFHCAPPGGSAGLERCAFPLVPVPTLAQRQSTPPTRLPHATPSLATSASVARQIFTNLHARSWDLTFQTKAGHCTLLALSPSPPCPSPLGPRRSSSHGSPKSPRSAASTSTPTLRPSQRKVCPLPSLPQPCFLFHTCALLSVCVHFHATQRVRARTRHSPQRHESRCDHPHAPMRESGHLDCVWHAPTRSGFHFGPF